jgi:hypothetical protein
MDKDTHRDHWTSADQQRLLEALDQARRDLQTTQETLDKTVQALQTDKNRSSSSTENPQLQPQDNSRPA